MDNWLEDQRNRGQILHEHKIDEIHRQYDREVRTCDHDCAVCKLLALFFITAVLVRKKENTGASYHFVRGSKASFRTRQKEY